MEMFVTLAAMVISKMPADNVFFNKMFAPCKIAKFVESLNVTFAMLDSTNTMEIVSIAPLSDLKTQQLETLVLCQSNVMSPIVQIAMETFAINAATPTIY